MHEFNPMLCCAHDWHSSADPLAKRKFFCATCGARCVRDDKGQIVEYSATGKRPDENVQTASD
jgi:hypothetical protein